MTSSAPVLVIDDDPTVRDVVVRHLECDGIDVAELYEALAAAPTATTSHGIDPITRPCG